jgi:DNA-binding transcriptional LysR family regulator
MMDIWQLQIFCRVVELKSFSRAGKAIRLSQPTVSSHIKYLEDHFGCRLIDRLAKEVVPTKAGELLYTHAQRMIALRDEIESVMTEFQGKVSGRLMIGGSTIPGGYILPRMMGGFMKAYPHVTVSLSIGDTRKIIQDILSGHLELGMVGASTSDKQALQEKILEDDMCLIVPGDHKWINAVSIDMEMLLEEPFIIREAGSGTLKSLSDSMAQLNYRVEDLNIAAEMGSTEAVIQGIKRGIGVSILSRIAVSEDLMAGRLKSVAVMGLNLKRSFYLTTHRYKSLSPVANAFIQFLKKIRNQPASDLKFFQEDTPE